MARSTGALGGSGNTAGVSVAASQNLTYNAVTDGALTIGGNLAYAGAGTLGASIGANLDTGRINVLGNATTTANTITVNIFGNAASTTTGGGGTYTLLRGAGAGSSVGTATYTLGAIYNNTNFTVSSTLVKSATDLQATVTAATPLSTAYWKGTGSSNATVWSASSNGAVASNWTSDLAGTTVSAVVPGATTDVIFSATGTTSPATSTLGSDMTIKSLAVRNTAAMTVNADGYALTISPSNPAVGISLNAQAALTFNPTLVLGASQTWANYSGATFTVGNNVVNGGNTLTVTGPNQTTITGTYGGTPDAAGGSGGIVKNGTGTLVLQGYNTFTGGITINQGTVQFENPNAFGTGTLTIAGAGATINGNFANLINANNNAVALNADLTSTGSQFLNLGTGTMTLGTAATATSTTRTITVNSNPLVIGGVITGSGTTTGLAKAGNNTLVLAAQNTYTGNTAVTNGTLRIGTSNAIPAGNSLALFAGQTVFAGGAAPTFDLNGVNQSLGSLTISGLQHNVGSTITNANVAAPSTLTLTGGATAVTFAVPLSGSAPTTATISTNFVALAGAAQTFNVADGNGNPDLTITSIVQNGSIVKSNAGQMGLQGPNTYTGTTSVFGGVLQVSSNLGSINQSSGIVIGSGGTLLLTNAQNQTGIDRLRNTSGIDSYGGGLQFQNTSSQGVVYGETVGTLALATGQFDVFLNNDMAGGAGTSGPTNSQTLTLAGLSQSGTGTVTFAVPNAAGPNTTTNIVVNSAAVGSATPAGQIIGPWAVVGVNNQQYSDYAVYNAAGQIVPANIASSAQTTWTNSTAAYTMGTAFGTGNSQTLTASRTVAALRNVGRDDTLSLNQFNLETNGLFAYSQNNGWTISSTGGVVRQNGTAPGNLYVTTSNQGPIFITAPIADNTGALTLVKSGYQNLYLRGVNTYTGGTVMSAGTTFVNAAAASAFGTGTITFAGGTLDNDSVQLPTFMNPVVLNGFAGYAGTNNNSLVLGGSVSLGTAPGAWRTINVGNSARLIITGALGNSAAISSIEKAGSGSLVLAGQNTYTGDTILTGGTIQLAAGNVGTLGAITSSPVGTGRLLFNGGGLSSSGVVARTVLNPVAFNGSVSNTSAILGEAANNGPLTFSAGIDLGFAPRVINTPSAVQFDGVVSGTGGVGGGGLAKSGQGVLTLANAANTYQGITAVVGGVLRPTVVGAIPANTNLVVASTASLGTATLDLATNSIDLTVGAVQMGGPEGIIGNNNAFNATATSYSLVNTGSATLTLGGDLTLAANRAAYTAAIQGKLALGDLNLTINNPVVNSLASTPYFARNFVIGDSANAAPDLNVAAVVSGSGVGINKSGGGMLQLSAANTFTGGILVNGGTLMVSGTNATTLPTTLTSGTIVARTANALGGTANTSGVTVAAGQNLTYNATGDTTLNIGGNLAISGGGTFIGGTIGGTTSSAAINVAGVASISAGAAQRINVYGLTGITPTGGPTNYTLITGNSSSTLNGGTLPTLNFVYNNTNFTVGAIAAGNVTATAITVPVTAANPLATAYWKGSLANATQVLAASNGGTQSNWTTTINGSNQPLVPGPTTDVLFSMPFSTSSAGMTDPSAATLGSDMNIRSLTLQDYVLNRLQLNGDGYTLGIGSGGINVLGGLNAQIPYLNANVKLNAAQAWTVNANQGQFNPQTPNTQFGNNGLTVGGNVDTNGNLLTVNAATGQAVQIYGIISGSGGLTKIGQNILTLAGPSTYTGDTTINYGTIRLDGNGAPGASPLGNGTGTVTVNDNNAVLDLNGQTIYTTPALFLAGNNATGALTNNSGTAAPWNGDITLQRNASIGGNVIVGGSGAFTGNGYELTLNGGQSLGNFARTIDTGVKSLTKAGGGTWTLGAANTLTGPVLVSNGTLRLGNAAAIPSGNQFAVVSVGNAATFDLNGFNQSLGNLTMSSLQQIQVSYVTSSGGTSTLTLTGGANAFTFTTPFKNNLNPQTAYFSHVAVDMNGGATFNVADGGGNPDVQFGYSAPLQNGTLTKTNGGQIALQGVNTYTGVTNILGGQLQISGDVGKALQSSGFVIGNGASLLLTNTQTQNFSRIGASAPIASFGGGLQFNNTPSDGIAYAQTTGALTLDGGQFDVYLNNDQTNTSNSQTLTLGGLTQAGTSVATFSAPSGATNWTNNRTGLNATTNIVRVTGATATPAGQIIGPWATVGFSTGQLCDYATFDASGNIVAANIAGSSQATWLDATKAYTTGTTPNGGGSGSTTLTGDRTMMALRDVGSNDILTMNQFNLQTNGLLNHSNGNWNINSTGGVIRQNGTAAAKLYVTTSDLGSIYINAPVADNTGALTLVKSGYQNLYLRGANTYTGGTVLNAGTTYVNASAASALGTGTLTFAGGTLDNDSVQLPAFSNPVVLNGTAGYGGTSNFGLTLNGSVSLGTAPGVWRQIGVGNSSGITFNGVISNGTTATGIEKTGSGNLVLAAQNTYTGDTILSNGGVQLAVDPVGSIGAITSGPLGTGRIVFNGGGLASDATPRTIINPIAFSGSAGGTANLNGSLGSGIGGGKLTVAVPMDFGFAPRYLATYGDVQFDGLLAGSGVGSGQSANGGTTTGGGGLIKGGAGLLTVTNAANSYNGSTAVVGGTLRPTAAGAIPANTNLTVAGNIASDTATLDLATNSIDLTIGTLNMGGSAVIGNNGLNASTSWSLINTGSATLTLGGTATYDNSVNAYTATIAGKLALGTANLTQYNTGINQYTGVPSYFARDFSVGDNSNAGIDMNVSAVVSGTAGLAKTGGGTLLLSGNNTFTGATVVNAGTLAITGNNTTTGTTLVNNGGTLMTRSANALGGSGNTAGVTVATGSAFAYNPTTDTALAIGGNLTFTGSNNLTTQSIARFGAAIGSTATSAQINVTGVATIPNVAQTIDIYGVPGATPSTGTYTLVQGGANSSLNPATAPTIGLVYNSTNFTVGSFTRSATALQVGVTAATPLTSAYWRGGLTNATQVWAASNGTTSSNWSLTTGGSGSAAQVLVPGAGTDVYFVAPIGTTAAAASPNATTLGADVAVRGLTFNDYVNSLLQLNPDPYRLSIGAGGISLLGGLQNQGLTIYPDITLTAAQTWLNNTPQINISGTNYNNNYFNIYSNVANGGNDLTLAAINSRADNFYLYGGVSGSGGLTKVGLQTVYLAGANTYSGPTTINGGNLRVYGQAGSIAGTSGIAINQGSLQLESGSANESLVNRVGDSTPITTSGGILYFNNSAAINARYVETIGTVTVTGGQFDVNLQGDQSASNNAQKLMLGGLSRSGTATLSFSSPLTGSGNSTTTGLNATTNVVNVAGATATPAGQIIGPWATVGLGLNDLRDYAAYDASGNVVSANIASSAETTWTNAADAYTDGSGYVSVGRATTLTGNRTMAALRQVGASNSLNLGPYNLSTDGFLEFANGNSSINAAGGVIRQAGTAPGAVYLTNGGQGNLSVTAPIADNTGALTLVIRNAGGNLALQAIGANTYSGGLALNSGTTRLNSVTAAGSGPITFAGGWIDQNVQTVIHNGNNNPITINADFGYGGSQSLLDLGSGAVSLGSTPAGQAGAGNSRTIYVNGNILMMNGAIANGTTANSLTKANGGTLWLGGNNTYTGTTSVTGGTLVLGGANAYAGATTIGTAWNGTAYQTGTILARNGGALGGVANTAGVTVNQNSGLLYAATSDAPLAIGGALTVTGGTSTTLGGSIGSTTTSAQINVAGAATISNAAHTVNVYGVPGTTPATGTYTLIQGGTGSSLNPATAPTLGLVYNNTNFTVGSFTRSANALQVGVTSATPLTTAYWKGGLTNATQTWAVSNGSTQSNWVATSGGTAQALVPGAGTNVVFDGVSYLANHDNIRLGADVSVRGMTMTTINSSMQVHADGYTLTVGAGGLTLGTPTATTNLGMLLYPDIVLGAAQTWTTYNVNGSGLSAYGSVNNSGNLLTVAPVSSSAQILGVVSGSGGLTKNGGSTLNLQGNNTYTGPTTINAGQLALQNAYQGTSGAILGTSSIAINRGSLYLGNGTQEAAVNRIGDATPITAHGGNIQFNNTSTAGVNYAETIGTVTVGSGQFDLILNSDQSAGSTQTLTLSGLSRASTATVTATAQTTQPNARTNMVQVSGASATPAGQIVGGWFTTGTDTNNLQDFASYTSTGLVVPAAIAGSAETTWTNSANAYTDGSAYGTSTNTTLTANRAIAALRHIGTNDTLNLSQFNLETNALLAYNASTFNVNSTTGVIRQNGTAAASLFVTSNAAGGTGLAINAPIVDNTGALTVVKSGPNYLKLAGANSFTGGLVLNSGTTYLNSQAAAGTGTLVLAGGSLDTDTYNQIASPAGVTINADFTFQGSSNFNLNLGNGAVTLGTAGGLARTITVNNAGTLFMGGAVANGTTVNSLAKAGSGRLVLGGANTYTGDTTVLGGTLTVERASGLGAGAGNVTVAAGTTLNYAAAADAQLALGSLAVTAGGTTLGGAIGSTATSAQINVAGAATISDAAHTVNVYGIPGTTPATGTYTLIQGGTGSSLAPTTAPTLGFVYNNTNFTVGSFTRSANALQVGVTSATPLTTAFWKGGLTNATQVWAASNGTTTSNWATTSGGSGQVLVPGAGASLVFSGATYSATANGSTLGADMTVAGLTQQDATNAVVLNVDGFGLTVGTGGITIAAGAHDVTLNPDVVMAGAQSWTNNNGGRTLTVNGRVTNGGNLLTIAGAGPVAIGGPVGGSGGITKSGAGNLTLSGVNSFTGPLSFSSGTVNISGVGMLGLGSYSQNIAIGAGTLTHSSGASQTFSGVLSGTGGQLQKTGNGTLTLTNDNTYTGTTTVSAGSLALSGNNAAATGGMSVTGGFVQFAAPASINGTARNVTLTSPAVAMFGTGFAAGDLQSALLGRIVASSSGVIAVDNQGNQDVNFTAAGFSSTPSLGAVGNVTYTGTFTPNGTTYRLGGGGGVLTMANANAITGAGRSLSVVGSGTVVLGGANDFTGSTTVASGSVLQLGTGATGQNGSVGSTTIANSGTVAMTNFESQSLAIPVTGTGSFAKSGGGTVTVSVAQTYTGSTTVSAGTLALRAGDQTLAVNRTLQVNGGTLDLGGNRQYVGSFTGTGGSVTGTSRFTTNAASGTYAGTLDGSLEFVKAGGNTLTLTAASTTTGALGVIGGQVTLKDAGTLAAGSGAVGVNFATLALDDTGSAVVAARIGSRPITLTGGTLSYLNENASNATQSVGTVTLAANTGVSAIALNRANVTGVNSTLTLDSLTRSAGSMLYIPWTSGANDLGLTSSGQRILLADNGASLTLVNGVVPGIVTFNGNDQYRAVTYTTANGFLPVGYTGAPATVNDISSGGVPAATTANVFNTGSAQSVLSGGQTINSLSLRDSANNVSFLGTATDTLTVSSGNIISLRTGGAYNFGTTANRGAVTSGQSELFWYAAGMTVNVNSVIKDNASGAVKFVYGGSGANMVLTAPNTYTGGTIVSGTTMTLTATAGAGTLVIPNATDPATGVVINNATLNSTLAGQIGSANVVTLNGGATLSLAGANTLSGLVFNSNGGTATPTVSGGTLTVTGGIVSTPTNVAVTPTISSSLSIPSSAIDVTVASPPEGNVVNDGGSGATLNGLVISSVISGSGGLTKKGPGVLNLTNTGNTFSGSLTIEAGVVNVASVNNVSTNGVLGNSGLPVILGGAAGTRGTLQYTGGNTTSTKPFELAAGGGGFQIDTAATVLGLGGDISGSGGLVKSGAGTLNLTSAKTFGGDTLVAAGTLQLSDRLALQYSPLDTSGAGSVTLSSVTTPRLGGLKGGRDLAAVITSGYASVTALALDTVAGTATYTGAIANGASGMTLTKHGLGTQILAGANTYTGATTINDGTLQIGAGGTTGSLSPSSAIINDRRLAFSRSDTLTQGIDFAAVITGQGDVVQRGTGTTLLTGFNMYFGETIVEAGTLAVGPSGHIDFSSGVRIGSGTFAYNNSNRLALPVSFTGTGGTIGGTGEIGFNGFELVISMGNTLSPGSSPGIFSQTGNQTWGTGGNYNWQMYDAAGAPGQGYDQMLINGLLDIQPGFNLNLWSLMGIGPDANGDALNFDDAADGHWVIASATSGLLGAANLSQGIIHVAARNGTAGFTNPFAGSFQLTQGGSIGSTTTNDVVLVYVIPEPGTLLLAAAAIAGLCCVRRMTRACRRRPGGA